MTPQRDVDEEQAFLDLAYASLDAMRRDAEGLRDSVLDLGRGGTFQSRTERDIVVRGAANAGRLHARRSDSKPHHPDEDSECL
jgi:hypothetical protein